MLHNDTLDKMADTAEVLTYFVINRSWTRDELEYQSTQWNEVTFKGYA